MKKRTRDLAPSFSTSFGKSNLDQFFFTKRHKIDKSLVFLWSYWWYIYFFTKYISNAKFSFNKLIKKKRNGIKPPHIFIYILRKLCSWFQTAGYPLLIQIISDWNLQFLVLLLPTYLPIPTYIKQNHFSIDLAGSVITQWAKIKVF